MKQIRLYARLLAATIILEIPPLNASAQEATQTKVRTGTQTRTQTGT